MTKYFFMGALPLLPFISQMIQEEQKPDTKKEVLELKKVEKKTLGRPRFVHFRWNCALNLRKVRKAAVAKTLLEHYKVLKIFEV